MRSRNWSRRSRYSLVGAWVGAGAVKNRIAPASKNNTIMVKYDNRISTAKLHTKNEQAYGKFVLFVTVKKNAANDFQFSWLPETAC